MVGATYMVLKACRGCLTTTGKLERVTDLTRRVFFTICGLQVVPNDGLPQYLCTECSASLRKTLAFRRKTRRAYFALNEIKKQYQVINKEITTKDVRQVDRVATNLVSSHGFWKPDNTALYSINVGVGPDPDTADLDPVTKAKVEKAKQESLEFLKFQEDKEKNDIVKDQDGLSKEAPLIKNNVSILVDIKPANYKELDKLERQRQEEEALRQIREEDSLFDDADNACDNAEDGEIDPATIDMNDIFKDLEEKEKEDSDDGLSEVFLPKSTRRIRQEREKMKYLKRPTIVLNKNDAALSLSIAGFHMYRDCLGMAKIRYMSPEEQIEAFKKRAQRKDYITAKFRCSMCLISVPDREKLINHSFDMHKYKEACCDICKAGFADESILEVHKAWQHWYEYTCVCGEIYYTFADLSKCIQNHPVFADDYLTMDQLKQRHQEQEDRIEKYFDKILLPPDKWSLAYNTAGRRKIVDKLRVICNLCGDAFNSVKLLKEHQKEETIVECEYVDTECYVCQRHFNTKAALSNHFEKSHAYMYKCKRCPHESYRNDALTHSCKEFVRYKAGPIEPSSHHCVECAQYFTSRAALLAHQLDKHCMIKISTPELTPSEFSCGFCNLRFANEFAIKNHKYWAKHGRIYNVQQGKITELEENTSLTFPAKCPHCDEMYKSQKILNCHITKQHPEVSNVEMVVCDVCGVLMAKNTLPTHLKNRCSQAVGRKRCTVCLSTFSEAWALIAHKLRCHIVKPYACARCFLRFSKKDVCKLHILKIHAPQKLYRCNMCNIEFSCSQYCRQHMRRLHKIKMPRTKDTAKRHSANHKNLICYPDMRFVVTDIPMSIIEDCNLMMSDYLDTDLTPVPKDQIKEYFILDLDTEIVTGIPGKLCNSIRYVAKNKKKKKQTPKKEPTQENVVNDELVFSYVRDQDGGFFKKEESEQNVELCLSEQDNVLDISHATDQDGGVINTEKGKVKKGKKGKKDKKDSKIETEWEDSIAKDRDMPMLIDKNAELHQEPDEQGFFTQKPDIIEENPPENDFQEEVVDIQTNLEESQCPEIGTEENPLRMEIDADELIRKYGIVMLDGVQYANIDGTLYKVEYS